ncbi:hypothetical protein DXN04_27620 [Chitinophaga silvisoli]|uniref:Uncharacterized protein n=1 Tax=Chitinophaga silvisoli TaxID=2291814 RepID=A0A3E1NUA9_9BACT|nr:hypothetical protein DXN04_27620 [Chitinophaga silvisoli]
MLKTGYSTFFTDMVTGAFALSEVFTVFRIIFAARAIFSIVSPYLFLIFMIIHPGGYFYLLFFIFVLIFPAQNSSTTSRTQQVLKL